jgi:ribosomal protein L44E
MLFRKTVAVYCENHTEHTDIIRGQNAVSTSQETHYVSTTAPNRLMLFRETIAVYCENNTKHKAHSVDGIQSFSMLKHVMYM